MTDTCSLGTCMPLSQGVGGCAGDTGGTPPKSGQTRQLHPPGAEALGAPLVGLENTAHGGYCFKACQEGFVMQADSDAVSYIALSLACPRSDAS